jgi:hypothetical protein
MTNSMRTSRRTAVLGSLATVAAAILVAGTAIAAPTTPTQSYRVTIQNLAAVHADATSQVLSPALVVIHDRNVDLFSVGEAANASVIAMAEDAISATGISALTGVSGVFAVSSEGTSILPGASSSFEVSVKGNARYLSFVSKLVNTNDGFIGLDGVLLTGGTRTYPIFALDAGSEVNDQLTASIPGPCCNNVTQAGTSESLMIARHAGIIANVGDLTPALWGWPVNEPIALVTIERLR